MRTTSSSPNAPQPAGPYSPAARVGDFIALAGQVGYDSNGNIVGSDVASQTRQALQNLLATLIAAGGSEGDIISLRVFLTDVDDFDAMNEVCAEVLSEPYPARSTIYVGLPPGLVVEVDALAVVAS